MNDRRGFTIVELLVVAVLGALVLVATYNVLITNQRTYTVNAANIQGQQTVRAGMDLLFGELREISPEGGDLLRMDDDSVTIRVMRSAGIVCDSVSKGLSGLTNNSFLVIFLGDTFVATADTNSKDSIWLFAEHDSTRTDDDVWVKSDVRLRGRTTCQGRPAQELRFSGLTGGLFDTDTPTLGSLTRQFTTYTYGLGTWEGEPYLIRVRGSDGSVSPLVGPLMSTGGVTFEYLDATGTATAVGADVTQIVVTVRTQHEARTSDGERITDSLKARIYPRN